MTICQYKHCVLPLKALYYCLFAYLFIQHYPYCACICMYVSRNIAVTRGLIKVGTH